MSETTARLFVALWPTPRERAALAAWLRACRFPPRASVVADERLHVTLHFLGDVPRERIGAIDEALPRAIPRFTLHLDRAAVWPSGVAVIEPREAPPAVLALQRETGERLAALGFVPEARRYRPHVTLARHARGARLAEPLPPLAWRPSRVVLVESVRGAGTTYRICAPARRISRA